MADALGAAHDGAVQRLKLHAVASDQIVVEG